MILTIDFSHQDGRLILAEKDKIISRGLKPAGRKSENLLSAIDDLAGARLSKIDGFAVVLPPSGFTSQRVAASVVNALAFSNGAKAISLPAKAGESEKDLVSRSITALKRAKIGALVMPEYILK